MPIYRRECKECKHSIEQLESIKAEDTIICPSCGKKTFAKCISNIGGFRMRPISNDNVSHNYK